VVTTSIQVVVRLSGGTTSRRTERSVEQRLKEINSATGVAEPYGARAVWTVQGAPQIEKAVHQALSGYRVRADREFFELSYGTAFTTVRDIVQASRREL
jgi:hypothetical protein